MNHLIVLQDGFAEIIHNYVVVKYKHIYGQSNPDSTNYYLMFSHLHLQ